MGWGWVQRQREKLVGIGGVRLPALGILRPRIGVMEFVRLRST